MFKTVFSSSTPTLGSSRRYKAALAGAAAFVALAGSLPATAAVSHEQPATQAEQAPRTPELLKKYELDRSNLAIGGYDPVGYFPEGDPKGKGDAIKGSKKIELTHDGITYRFSNPANRELFKKYPDRYEPAHGGWCSYAASQGSYTEPSPKNFIVEDGRLFLFYKDLFTNTKSLWEEAGTDTLAPQADTFWQKETGEQARSVVLDANGDRVVSSD
jgi:YHS domain-containing protein